MSDQDIKRDWYVIAEQPAPAPHLAHPEGCAALRIELVMVPRVSRSCEHFPDGFDLHLLQDLKKGHVHNLSIAIKLFHTVSIVPRTFLVPTKPPRVHLLQGCIGAGPRERSVQNATGTPPRTLQWVKVISPYNYAESCGSWPRIS